MSTMNEALENVNYDQLNDWERGFYDDQKGKSYAPSPKQLAIINKMPKKNGGSNNENKSSNDKVNVKSESNEIATDVDGMIFQLGEIVEKLKGFDWYNRLGDDAQQKHATTIFLAMRDNARYK
tara:strand:+ start:138 stop:506 length:369 start_codon:yes stop_codon:yes gene_type:complete